MVTKKKRTIVKTGTDVAQVRSAIEASHGSALTKLEAKGRVVLVQSEQAAMDLVAKDRDDGAAPSGLDIKESSDGQVQGFFDAVTGKAYLIADGLTPETASAVLMHEVGIHMANDGTMQPLYDRATALLQANPRNPFIARVQQRMDAAQETSGKEAAAYIAGEYELSRAGSGPSVVKFVQDMVAAVRAWMYRNGVVLKAGQLTTADIAAIARANTRSLADSGAARAADGGLKYSKLQVQIDPDGMPEIQGDGVYIGFAQPIDVLEYFVTRDSEQVYNHPIMSGGMYVGEVDVLYVDGKPSMLFDTDIDEDQRGQQLGIKTVEALLYASADGKLDISNILPSAQGFWEKLGISIQNLGEGETYDGKITLESYAASAAGKNRRAAQAGSRTEQGLRSSEAGRKSPDANLKFSRTSAATNQALERLPVPKPAKKALGEVSQFLLDMQDNAILLGAFTRDLVSRAAKHMEAAPEYFKLMSSAQVSRGETERKLAGIVEAYNKLNLTERGKKSGSVNALLQQATTDKEWPFLPEFLGDRPHGYNPQSKAALAFGQLTEQGQDVVRKVFTHGHENLKEIKAVVDENIRSEYDARTCLGFISPKPRRS